MLESGSVLRGSMIFSTAGRNHDEKLRIYVEDSSRKAIIEEMIESNGGTVVTEVDAATYAVVSENMLQNQVASLPGADKIPEGQLPTSVDPDWVYDCLKKGFQLPAEDYRPRGPAFGGFTQEDSSNVRRAAPRESPPGVPGDGEDLLNHGTGANDDAVAFDFKSSQNLATGSNGRLSRNRAPTSQGTRLSEQNRTFLERSQVDGSTFAYDKHSSCQSDSSGALPNDEHLAPEFGVDEDKRILAFAQRRYSELHDGALLDHEQTWEELAKSEWMIASGKDAKALMTRFHEGKLNIFKDQLDDPKNSMANRHEKGVDTVSTANGSVEEPAPTPENTASDVKPGGHSIPSARRNSETTYPVRPDFEVANTNDVLIQETSQANSRRQPIAPEQSSKSIPPLPPNHQPMNNSRMRGRRETAPSTLAGVTAQQTASWGTGDHRSQREPVVQVVGEAVGKGMTREGKVEEGSEPAVGLEETGGAGREVGVPLVKGEGVLVNGAAGMETGHETAGDDTMKSQAETQKGMGTEESTIADGAAEEVILTTTVGVVEVEETEPMEGNVPSVEELPTDAKESEVANVREAEATEIQKANEEHTSGAPEESTDAVAQVADGEQDDQQTDAQAQEAEGAKEIQGEVEGVQPMEKENEKESREEGGSTLEAEKETEEAGDDKEKAIDEGDAESKQTSAKPPRASRVTRSENGKNMKRNESPPRMRARQSKRVSAPAKPEEETKGRRPRKREGGGRRRMQRDEVPQTEEENDPPAESAKVEEAEAEADQNESVMNLRSRSTKKEPLQEEKSSAETDTESSGVPPANKRGRASNDAPQDTPRRTSKRLKQVAKDLEKTPEEVAEVEVEKEPHDGIVSLRNYTKLGNKMTPIQRKIVYLESLYAPGSLLERHKARYYAFMSLRAGIGPDGGGSMDTAEEQMFRFISLEKSLSKSR